MSENSITIAMPAIPTLPEVEALKEICKVAAYSGFLSSTAPRSDMAWRSADAFFVVMYGRELGIPAMTALKTIYVVDGKPSCSGQALLSLMRRAGVEIEIPDPSTITDKATVRIRRPGGEWREYTYTRKMAEDAGLWGRKTWEKYWREMLIWRAVSTANKFESSDITGGLYTIEELAPNTPVDADGMPVGDVILEVRREEPRQLPHGDEPATTTEQPSASVSGAGVRPVSWADNPQKWEEFLASALDKFKFTSITVEEILGVFDGLGFADWRVSRGWALAALIADFCENDVTRIDEYTALMAANGTDEKAALELSQKARQIAAAAEAVQS